MSPGSKQTAQANGDRARTEIKGSYDSCADYPFLADPLRYIVLLTDADILPAFDNITVKYYYYSTTLQSNTPLILTLLHNL